MKIVAEIIILILIARNKHNHGILMSRALDPNYVFESKEGKSMLKWGKGIFLTLCVEFCLVPTLYPIDVRKWAK